MLCVCGVVCSEGLRQRPVATRADRTGRRRADPLGWTVFSESDDTHAICMRAASCGRLGECKQYILHAVGEGGEEGPYREGHRQVVEGLSFLASKVRRS
mmetsp:Transcript_19643/g.47615  ORF Transcript_19643/g.47615 Transcript_19643/m.47615 type:complete len:99 (+) Transcript_19643:609-905(+)